MSSLSDQSDSARRDGDVLVLGSEVFVSADERVICWRGVNYVRQDSGELHEALQVALDAMKRSADDHNCDYCRADIAAVERAMGEPASDEDDR